MPYSEATQKHCRLAKGKQIGASAAISSQADKCTGKAAGGSSLLEFCFGWRIACSPSKPGQGEADSWQRLEPDHGSLSCSPCPSPPPTGPFPHWERAHRGPAGPGGNQAAQESQRPLWEEARSCLVTDTAGSSAEVSSCLTVLLCNQTYFNWP